jgi:hypothetical protein
MSTKQAGIGDFLFPGVFGPDNHPAMQAAAEAREKLKQQTESALTSHYGQNMRQMLGYGLAGGAGATALYHALRALRKPKKSETKYDEMNSGAPVMAKEALSLDEMLGKLVPTTMTGLPSGDGAGNGGAPAAPGLPADPHMYRPTWAALAALGAGGLGLYGGNKAVGALVNRNKKKDSQAEIDEARKAYYDALLGGDKKAAALDDVYAAWQEKHANPLTTVRDAFNSTADFFGRTVPQSAHALALLGALGGGAYSAKKMYDWTKSRSEGENLRKAQASKARMKGLPTTWVDPEELTRIKELAAQADNEQ